MSKRKESEVDPDAEKWLEDEDARFEAEVAAAQADAEAADEDKRLQRQLEADEEEAMRNAGFGDGPEYGDEEEDPE
jgi:hypothetical protein